MTFRLGRLATAVGITIALVSCGAPPTAQPTGSGSSAAESKYEKYEALKGQERRDQLVKDAKAEGELSLYTSMTSDVALAVAKAFTDKFGIKVNLYRAASETVLQRILQESSARPCRCRRGRNRRCTRDGRARQGEVDLALHRRASRPGRKRGPVRQLDGQPLQPLRPQLEHHEGAPPATSRRAGRTWPTRSGTASWPWSCPITTGT